MQKMVKAAQKAEWGAWTLILKRLIAHNREWSDEMRRNREVY
jgi:hypothetical protein